MFKSLFASKKRPFFRGNGRLEPRKFDLSGCILEISMPAHDYEFPEEDCGSTFNLFDQSIYRYNTKKNHRGFQPHHKGVSYPGVFLRKWDSFGHILRSSPVGFLQCSLVVCDISKMETSFNCFNKNQMEQLLLHALYYSKGPGFGDNEHKSPVKWQIKCIDGVEWIYCESWSKKPAWKQFDDHGYDKNFSAWMVTPLFKDKYLLMAFTSIGSLPAKPSNKLMLERIHQIIPTVKLTLPPEAAKQKADAEQQALKMAYSQHRDPEPWRYYGSWREGNILKGEKEIVFEGECTPPPKLN